VTCIAQQRPGQFRQARERCAARLERFADAGGLPGGEIDRLTPLSAEMRGYLPE